MKVIEQLLIGRKELCRLLGGVSISHIIRLEHDGNLAKARVQVGPRAVKYEVKRIQELIESRKLF
ncbi:MAG: hypothetical protein JW803_04235 [Endomicrobiales bacterium]|nr:hypothetical protein [Endomicrobiales bacterium]